MPYGVHPSTELIRLFADKPYQGADPNHAIFLIIGNDANYSPEISDHAFFQHVLKYHEDGVMFWNKTGVHHPFMLEDYPFDRRMGGVPYHTNFQKLGFGREHAEFFCFIELLHVPTVGNTGSDKDLFFQLLDRDHLNWLESLVLGGGRKFVLVNQTLARSVNRIRRKLGVLKSLTSAIHNGPAPSIVLRTMQATLYNGYSFSASVSNEYLKGLSGLMRRFIRDANVDRTR